MSTASIGTQLKDARTKKTLSLEDVHGRLKIHPRVLQLLEEDKFDKLPSPLFAKSFLRTYAEFLEINTEEILSAYEKSGQKDPEQTLFIRPVDQRPAVPSQSTSDKRSTVLMMAVVVSAILLFTFGIYTLKKHRSIKPALISKTQKTTAKKTTTKKTTGVSATKTVEAKRPSDWLRSTEDGNFPRISSSASLQLGVRALDTVWLKVTCDEKVLFQGLLKKGAVETWNAKDSVEIWSGNASNMILSVNGSSIGSPGRGVVKRMLVTRQGVRSAS